MKEIIELLAVKLSDTKRSKEAINIILTQELSKLNPNRIDEERMKECHSKFSPTKYRDTITNLAVDLYNSNLPELLAPLPEEMPKDLSDKFEGEINYFVDNLWKDIYARFGTPQKELPNASELERDIFRVINQYVTPETMSYNLSKHLIDKYKLESKKDAFPFNLKKGDKFMWNGKERKLDYIAVMPMDGGWMPINECQPYTEPSMRDKFMASLSDEQKKMYNELENQKP